MKGVYFLQNANNLNFKLFLSCIHDPQRKYSAFIGTEGVLRLPTTYDNHPNPTQPDPIHKASLII